MRCAVALCCFLATPVMAEIVPPSGIRAELHETIYDPKGVPTSSAKTLRLRFVAAEIADTDAFDFATLEQDFEWLCTETGLPLVAETAPMVAEIIVSISSQIVAFGETAPSVVQYFDAFRVENAACIWEGL